MKRNENWFDEEENLEGKTKLTFKIIKGKPNQNPQDFALVINAECPEVQFEGQTCIRITTGSPAEFKAMSEFCHQYLGNFPAKSPYIYVPKRVLVQQPKVRRNKSLFKN